MARLQTSLIGFKGKAFDSGDEEFRRLNLHIFGPMKRVKLRFCSKHRRLEGRFKGSVVNLVGLHEIHLFCNEHGVECEIIQGNGGDIPTGMVVTANGTRID